MEQPNKTRLKSTDRMPSASVTSDIGIMGIYCPSWLFSHFLTAIDGINMPINGLGQAPEAIYTPLMQRSQ
ncbi:hypothetical protein A2U01_0059266, partial [Trifolium medium]|nr:hypothetical protein [Trifolium medium]